MGSECIRIAWLRHHAQGLAYALWNIVHPMLRAEDRRDSTKLRRLAGVRLDIDRIDTRWREGAALTVAAAVAIARRR